MNKITILLFCSLTLILSACAGHDMPQTKQSVVLPEISCVAVLPVAISLDETKLGPERKKALFDGATYMDSQLMAELDTRPEFKVLTEDQLDAILSDPWGGHIQQVVVVGHATGCGAVLETSLDRYRQRVGTTMSAEVPAAAAFSMELVGVKSGAVLWSTSFDEEQKALLDDILSFSKVEQRGFKWLSVEELVSDALDSRLAAFPYFKQETN